MQGQATRTHAISATQSLAAVQTLLRAGLGCITYLRDLLPDENFTQSHLVADEESFSYQDSDTSMSSTTSRQSRNSKGFKIYTMTRGYSDEADKMLNYLENGIFDALSKRYLRSFIFAIYLDNKDPNNIIEAYTFNFHYHTLPGSEVSVPIMTLGDGLQKMSLKDRDLPDDPISVAARNGRAPTLLDVKNSVKALLKRLIQATTQMDVLPKRRYATFKLFYTDETPTDYEPPHFKAADPEKDKWYFMTHDLDEKPDRWSVGKVNTGHHSVKLSVTSIATFLPSSNPDKNSTFLGLTSRLPDSTSLTPMQEANLRSRQAEQQSVDATERNVVWAVEEAIECNDLDAEGDDDPDYVRLPDGSYEKVIRRDLEPPIMAPIGVRNSSGEIVSLPETMGVDEVHFNGDPEAIPTCLDQVMLNKVIETSDIEPTQVIESSTQVYGASESCDNTPVSIIEEDAGFASNHGAMGLKDISASPSQDTGGERRIAEDMRFSDENTRTSDKETQIESIGSFTPGTGGVNAEMAGIAVQSSEDKELKSAIDNGLHCICEIDIEDECVWCEGGCGQWSHVWCMGYHSTKDTRIPSKFLCFDCRVRADFNWELIKIDLYPVMLSRFRDLALFRRAIKIVETQKPETAAIFTKALGGNNVLARQLFKRLETEGYIVEQFVTLDELGFPETRSRSLKDGRKTKGKQTKTRRNVQKSKFKFNGQAVLTAAYMDYFQPDPKVESRILGLSELAALRVPMACTGLDRGYDETQTQEPTLHDIEPKRRQSPALNEKGPNKKVKISVTHGLDLAE